MALYELLGSVYSVMLWVNTIELDCQEIDKAKKKLFSNSIHRQISCV